MRLARRRLLAAAGGAGAVLAGCGGGGRKQAATTGPPAAAATATSAGAAPTRTPVPRPTGGVARLAAERSFSFDTFDSQRTGEASVLEVLGRTHSRLVQWDIARGRLLPDLAAAWEQPDEQTLVLRLDPRARWQPRSPLDGRPVTAEDVAAHLRRAVALAATGLPALQRGHEVAGVATVAATGDGAVRVQAAAPDPFLLEALAGKAAMVQAPESAALLDRTPGRLDPLLVAGTGPFLFDTAADGKLEFRAHHGGHRPPLLDGIVVEPPGEASVERFLARSLDEVTTVDRRDAARVRDFGTGVRESWRHLDTPVVSTLFAGGPPWDNADLVRALGGALNRTVLAERLFGGRADPSSPAPPAFPGWALGPAELAPFPGYGADAVAEAKAARQRWEAAGGPALGTVTVDFPSIFDPAYSASSVVIDLLSETLGPQFRPAVETYTTIAAKAQGHRYGGRQAALWFGWGPPFAAPDPARTLIETYHSAGPGAATTGFRDETVDLALDRLRRAFDRGQRTALVREAALAVLAAGGGGVVDWLVQRNELFWWPYFEGPARYPWPGQWQEAEASLDQAAAAAMGRA